MAFKPQRSSFHLNWAILTILLNKRMGKSMQSHLARQLLRTQDLIQLYYSFGQHVHAHHGG